MTLCEKAVSVKSATTNTKPRLAFRVEVAVFVNELAGKETKELLARRNMNFRLAGNGPETYRKVTSILVFQELPSDKGERCGAGQHSLGVCLPGDLAKTSTNARDN